MVIKICNGCLNELIEEMECIDIDSGKITFWCFATCVNTMPYEHEIIKVKIIFE